MYFFCSQHLWNRCVYERLRMCLRKEIDTVCHLSHITCSLRRSQHTSPCGTPNTQRTHTCTRTNLHQSSECFSLTSLCLLSLSPGVCRFPGAMFLLTALDVWVQGLCTCVCVCEGKRGLWLAVKSRAVNLSWCLMQWHERERERERWGATEEGESRRGGRWAKEGGSYLVPLPVILPSQKMKCCHNWFDADAVSCAPYLILLWCPDI